MRKLAIVSISIFVFFTLLSLALKTPYAQNKAQQFLLESLGESGVNVQIESLEGNLPRQIILKQVSIEAKGYQIDIEFLEGHLSLWRLFKKEIAFTELKGSGIKWKKQEGNEAPFNPGEGLPFLLNLQYVKLEHVMLTPGISVGIEGSFRLGRRNRYAFADLIAKQNNDPKAQAHLIASLNKRRGIEGKLTVDTPSLSVLPFSLPVDGPLQLSCKFDSNQFAPLFGKKGDLRVSVKGEFSPSEIPLVFSASGTQNSNGEFRLRKMNIKSPFGTLKGRGLIDENLQIVSGEIQVQSDLKKALPTLAEGRLFGYLHLQREGQALQTKASWRVPKLSLSLLETEEFQGNIQARLEQGMWTGNTTLQGKFFKELWKGNSHFTWSLGSSVRVEAAELESPSFHLQGQGEIRTDAMMIGSVSFDSSQIHTFAPRAYGTIQGKAIFGETAEQEAPVQTLQLDFNGSDIYFDSLFFQSLSLYSDLKNPFNKPIGTISLACEKGRWNQLFIESASLETENDTGENWPFAVSIEGEWKHPLALNLGGFWNYKASEWLISLQNGSGSFFNHPLQLAAPAQFEYSSNRFVIDPLSLEFPNARMALSIHREDANTDAWVKMENLPLDFLSLNPLDIAIEGQFSLDASIRERGDELSGTCNMSVQNMEVRQLGDPDPFDASGLFKSTFTRDRLKFDGSLTVRETPLLNFDASLPIHLQIFPFDAYIHPNKSANGHLGLRGRIEDFLDFFDLGTHRLEGECNCDLKFFNSLAAPLIEGYCDFENGYYQNYFTGLELENIRAEFRGDGQTIYLRALQAEDAQKKGMFNATGQIEVRYQEQFPYTLNLDFSRLNCVQIDLVTAEAGGHLEITGNRESGIARGNIEILETDFLIPDRIPRQYPTLEVVYLNAAKPPVLPTFYKKKPYPLHLDIQVDAPDGIFISGRGLNSEWKGNFHLAGTQTAPAAKGKIELLRGDFVLSGRRFKLTDGALSMTGVENEMPYLNLAGSMEVKGVSIIARLKGALNNPQLTLQSVPPLPMGSIMAYLLFGQDLSEINSFQALQLANSLSSLAGEGPGVMESTRKSLGVDRLEVISVPSGDDEEGDTIALQVGKYVSEGVLVSFSQGAEDKSGNISIEVELKNGFSLTLESQQLQEQGVFGIKWRLNY